MNKLESQLFKAVKNDQLNLLQKVILRGVNVNVLNDDGFSALMIAAHYGHLKCMKLLICHGADINLQSKMNNEQNGLYSGLTALMLAIRHGHDESVHLLTVQPGIELYLETHDRSHFSAALFACSNKQYQSFVHLLNAGFDVNRQHNHKKSLLDLDSAHEFYYQWLSENERSALNQSIDLSINDRYDFRF